jgi:hypothetical protein
MKILDPTTPAWREWRAGIDREERATQARRENAAKARAKKAARSSRRIPHG